MMLRYLKFGLVLAATLGLPAAAVAAGSEAVTNFTQTATLSRAGSLTIAENIDYDFAGTAPHDITHMIPLSYHDDQGRDFRMAFQLTQAQLDGQPANLKPTVTSDIARLTLPPGIGAAVRHYTLSYTLAPVVLRGLDADVFKLSVTGLGWAVPINRATLRLETPTAPADNLTCYAGAQGSTTGRCTVDQQGNVANVTSYAALQPGEALSIFADFPHGSYGSYLQPYEPHPSSPLLLITDAAAAVVLVAICLIVVIRFRARRPIVGASSPDYTNANEASKDQAHRQ